MTILVIAAHPDDEVLGCGGTIARLARDGHAVHVAILGEGVTSRYPSREQADPARVAALGERSRRAAELLGARGVSLHGLPDNRFDTLPLLDLVKLVERQVAELKPEAVYTQHGGDLNLDHRLTFRATLTATRPVAGGSVRALYAFEVPSSTDWAFRTFEPPFRPNVFTDIGPTVDLKIEAMRIYDTETRPFPHPRSPEALRAAAARWGSVAGLEAAEAFELIRLVG